MKNLEDQQVLVFVNDYHQFVHIGVYNMYDKEGRPNYGATLQSQHRESLRARHYANKEDAKGTDRAFGNSFQVRLMNTGVDQWEVHSSTRNLELNRAQDIAHELSEFFASKGYSVTGSRGAKAVRHLGTNKYATNIIIKNATMKRIYEIIEKLTEGYQEVLDIRRVQSVIYSRYIDPNGGFDTRRKFWNFINENFEKYKI